MTVGSSGRSTKMLGVQGCQYSSLSALKVFPITCQSSVVYEER